MKKILILILTTIWICFSLIIVFTKSYVKPSYIVRSYLWNEVSDLWRMRTNSGFFTYLTLADLNNDDKCEILTSFSRLNNEIFSPILVLDGNTGTPMLNITARYAVASSIAVGDINDDNKPEIVAAISNYTSFNGSIWVLNTNGTIIWEQKVYAPWQLSLADIDCDRKLEVILGSLNYTYAFDDNGTLLWKIRIPLGCIVAPVVGNFDYDDALEIVLGSLNDNIYVIDDDGTLLWKFRTRDKITLSPALGDVDNDKRLEIIVASSNDVYALNDDSSLLWRINVDSKVTAGPILGDFDNDGKLEIVLGTFYGTIYVLNGEDGSLLWKEKIFLKGEFKSENLKNNSDSSFSFLTTLLNRSFPDIVISFITSDLDDDGILDIVVASLNGNVSIFRGIDGKMLWTFELKDDAFTHGISPLGSNDVDNDSFLELIICADHEIYVFDGFYGRFAQWNQFRGNEMHSIEICDFDLDGLEDKIEKEISSSIVDCDSDNDKLLDGWEYIHGLSPINSDSDNDCWQDGIEVFYESNPLNPFEHPSYPIMAWILVLLMFSSFIIIVIIIHKR